MNLAGGVIRNFRMSPRMPKLRHQQPDILNTKQDMLLVILKSAFELLSAACATNLYTMLAYASQA